jgi:hypothetical protein
LLLLGGNIRVKDRNNTVKVGDQRSGSRFPIGRGFPETNTLFHFITANARIWHTLKQAEAPKTPHRNSWAKDGPRSFYFGGRVKLAS